MELQDEITGKNSLFSQLHFHFWHPGWEETGCRNNLPYGVSLCLKEKDEEKPRLVLFTLINIRGDLVAFSRSRVWPAALRLQAPRPCSCGWFVGP